MDQTVFWLYTTYKHWRGSPPTDCFIISEDTFHIIGALWRESMDSFLSDRNFNVYFFVTLPRCDVGVEWCHCWCWCWYMLMCWCDVVAALCKVMSHVTCCVVFWHVLCLVVSLAPVPLSIFRSNSKFDENSKHSSVKYTRPIITIFCTRHDSVTVVTCAKYCCDRSSISETRAFWIFIEFRIRSKYA